MLYILRDEGARTNQNGFCLVVLLCPTLQSKSHMYNILCTNIITELKPPKFYFVMHEITALLQSELVSKLRKKWHLHFISFFLINCKCCQIKYLYCPEFSIRKKLGEHPDRNLSRFYTASFTSLIRVQIKWVSTWKTITVLIVYKHLEFMLVIVTWKAG